jgi:hypothetical protein
MHTMTPDPLAVLQVAEMHDITEEQAATAINWAAHITVHAWDAYADYWGLDSEDGAAMEKWEAQLHTTDRRAILEVAVAAVKSPDGVLADVYRRRDEGQSELRAARVMRTNRPRVHIH